MVPHLQLFLTGLDPRPYRLTAASAFPSAPLELLRLNQTRNAYVLLRGAACRGYRALGFGLADGNGSPDAPGTHWEFLGLLPLFDPPRHDTAETIRRCQHMGIGGEVTGGRTWLGIDVYLHVEQ